MEKFFIITIIFVGLIPLAFGEAFIQNDQQYIGDDGALHIVGEIKNNLESPVNQINIHVTLLDENNHQIVTKVWYPKISSSFTLHDTFLLSAHQ